MQFFQSSSNIHFFNVVSLCIKWIYDCYTENLFIILNDYCIGIRWEMLKIPGGRNKFLRGASLSFQSRPKRKRIFGWTVIIIHDNINKCYEKLLNELFYFHKFLYQHLRVLDSESKCPVHIYECGRFVGRCVTNSLFKKYLTNLNFFCNNSGWIFL